MTINALGFSVIYMTRLIEKTEGICRFKGVYRMDCIENGHFYIDTTMQLLCMRFNQHKGNIRLKP